jgi:hypothetical protein
VGNTLRRGLGCSLLGAFFAVGFPAYAAGEAPAPAEERNPAPASERKVLSRETTNARVVTPSDKAARLPRVTLTNDANRLKHLDWRRCLREAEEARKAGDAKRVKQKLAFAYAIAVRTGDREAMRAVQRASREADNARLAGICERKLRQMESAAGKGEGR